MQKKMKNLGITFPPIKFFKSFVKVICLVADHLSSYIKNKSSSLIYTYSSMRKFKITIEKSYFCILTHPNGIQVAEAGYRYQPLGLVPHLGETHRQIRSLFCNASHSGRNQIEVRYITNDHCCFTTLGHRDG